MKKLLISACLLGEKVRYDGSASPVHSDIIDIWNSEGRLLPFCPEIAGGLATPRPPAEIQGGNGRDVITGVSRVITIHGKDISGNFVRGARQALNLANQNGICLAILKSGSPACGIGRVYDGSFSGKLTSGDGVTAALLKANGLKLYNEKQIEEAYCAFLELSENNG